MFFYELAQSFRRRWPVVLVLVALSGVLTYVAAQAIKPAFKAETNLVLVPPRSSLDPDLNRFLDLSSARLSVDVLVRSMTGNETTKALLAEIPSASYTVVSDLATSAPMLVVTASADEPAAADQMLGAVVAQLSENLASLQEEVDIPPSNQITAVIVSDEGDPQPDQKARLRLVGALFIMLMLASVVLTAFIDGLLMRRSAAGKSDTEDGLSESDGDIDADLDHVPQPVSSIDPQPVRSGAREQIRSGVPQPVRSNAPEPVSSRVHSDSNSLVASSRQP